MTAVFISGLCKLQQSGATYRVLKRWCDCDDDKPLSECLQEMQSFLYFWADELGSNNINWYVRTYFHTVRCFSKGGLNRHMNLWLNKDEPNKEFNLCFSGALPEDYREEWLPCSAVGAIHHTKWRWAIIQPRHVTKVFNRNKKPICSCSYCVY